MSEEGSFGLNLAERLFGLVIVLVGSLTTYYTFASNQALSAFTGLFGFLSILLVVIGLVLLTAKIEE